MRRSTAVGLLLALVALFSSAAPARAVGTLTISPGGGAPGDTIQAAGVYWSPGTVTLFLDAVGAGALGSATVGSDGSLSTTFTIPRGATAGTHAVIACLDHDPRANACRDTARADLQVVPPPSSTTTSTSAPTTTSTSTTTTTAPTTTTTTAPTTTTSATATTLGLGSPSTTLGGDPPSTTTPQVGIASTTTTPAQPGLASPDAETWPDLEIHAVEVTQGIQDLAGHMPLVADRVTWVRLYVAADKPAETVGTDSLTTGGAPSEWAVAGWQPVEGAILLERGSASEVLYPVNGPITVYGTGGDRLDPGATLNFAIPAEWTSEGQVSLSAFVWSFQPTTPDTMEPDATNNFAHGTVTFHTAAEPTAFAIRLTNGDVWSAVSTAAFDAAVATVEESLLTYHPISGATVYQLLPTLGPGPEAEDEGENGEWDLDDRAWEPNVRMGWFHALWDLQDDQWFLGIVPGAASSKWSGWANPGHHAVWTKDNLDTPGHEMGHAQGLLHVGCKDTKDPLGVPDELLGGAVDTTYATGFPNCSLAPIDPDGYLGFTTRQPAPSVYDNDPTGPNARFPLMSYLKPRWQDPYHTCLLLVAYGVPCDPWDIGAPPLPKAVDFGQPDAFVFDAQPLLDQHDGWIALVSVSFGDAGTPVIGEVMILDDPPSGAIQVMESQLEFLTRRAEAVQPPLVVVRDLDGAILFKLPLATEAQGHGEEGTGMPGGNLLALPWAAEAVTLELISPAGEILDSAAASAPPEIALLPVEVSGRDVVVSWEASDPDGDPLTFTVSTSADGGATWRPIHLFVPGNDAIISDEWAIAGGDAVVVRVTAGDGFASSYADSPPFALPGATPSIAINGATTEFALHAPGQISASAYDPEDGTLTDIRWTSDRDGPVGTGRRLETSSLSAGTHLLTATVADGDGNEAVDTLEIVVADTGIPTPRTEGDNPEVDSLLRTGPAGFDELGSEPASQPETPDATSSEPAMPVLAAAGAALVVLIGGVLMRRRRVSRR